jgi:trimeric autotransporter adhesin
MKILRFILKILILGALAISLNTCGGGDSVQLTSVGVTPENPVILIGTTQQFTAIGSFSGAPSGDMTAKAVWSSSNQTVATIGINGLARGLTAGTAIITATVGDVSGGTTLTVTSATLSSIAITPADPHVSEGTTLQFRAMGTFSDGTTHDVSFSTTWSSSNTAVSTVNSNGLATALTRGPTTITAVSGGVSATTTLTVT